MKGARIVLVALSMAMVLSLPVLGMALAAPKADVAARTMANGPLAITLLPALAMRTDWYGGAVIPVRILLTDTSDDSGVAGASVTVWVNDSPGASHGSVNVNNTMKDFGGGMYAFNLNTKPYTAGPGSAPITIEIVANAPADRSASLEVVVTLD